MIIPSIDLMDGKAVQLRQGKEKVLEEEDVFALAAKFRLYGEIAVIDLDAAMGKGDNIELIEKLCAIAPCRVGGGIRDKERGERLLRAGATKIIIGTKASPEFLVNFPASRVIVAVDTKGSKVVDEAWTRETDRTPAAVMDELAPYCSEFLFTDVDREGMMQGIDIEKVEALVKNAPRKVTVAGGITTIDEIGSIEKLGCNSQLGMCIYTGAVDLTDATLQMVKFDQNGLVPTIVQDDKDRVLMLANSSADSLRKTFETAKATYFSRSRNELWTKGETSGCYQDVLGIRYDCDRDALLMKVEQTDVACHTGSYSCFGDKGFELEDLYDILVERVENPVEGSYTSKIATDEKLIMEKISEEAGEVVNYTDDENLVWEIADLSYFLMVLMAKKGITPQQIRSELWRRRK